MEGKFPSKILVFVTAITNNCDSFSSWSQIFHILPSICEGIILPLQIRFFERAFWVRQKFLVANWHFSCSDLYLIVSSKPQMILSKKKKNFKWSCKYVLIFLVPNHQIMGDRHLSSSNNLQIKGKMTTILTRFGHENLHP